MNDNERSKSLTDAINFIRVAVEKSSFGPICKNPQSFEVFKVLLGRIIPNNVKAEIDQFNIEEREPWQGDEGEEDET